MSDQFKAVAKKLAEQFVSNELSKACPDDKPLCQELILGLSDAMSAAIEGNSSQLKTALSNFFVSSAIAGGGTLLLQDLVDRSSASPEVKRLAPVLAPLAKCVIDIMRDSRRGCSWEKAFKASFDGLKIPIRGRADQDAVNSLLSAVAEGKAPKPTDVIQTLQAVASHLHRYDVRVYLEAIKLGVNKGLEGGLYQFVSNVVYSQVSTIDQLRAGNSFSVFEDSDTSQAPAMPYASAFTTCGAPAVWSTWALQREAFRTDAQQAVRLGGDLTDARFAQLDALAGVPDCPTGTATAATRAVTQIRNNALFMRGALQLNRLQIRYGSLLLGIGAVLDLVRSGDGAQFDAHVVDLVGRQIEQLSWQACVSAGSAAVCEAAYLKNEPVCQTSFIVAILQKRDPSAIGACFDAVEQVDCKTYGPVALAAGAKQGDNGTCTFPELGFYATPSSWPTLVSAEVASLTKIDEDFLKTVLRAVQYLANDDPAASRKAIARYAVEKLLDYTSSLITTNLATKQEDCGKSTRSTSIFSGFGAKCAAVALIQAAYYPIADYLWDGGVTTKNEDAIANSAYKSLLESKYLAGSPIMLNLGLGANLIWGNESIWGNKPYRALTVVDKFGLEFYRYAGKETTFEVGPFVGGFLDALVRTIDGQDHKFWLAGLALGVPRIFNYNFGFEVHAAAALPFSFDDKKEIGFALGAVLVIPWDFWKEK